MRDSHQGKDFSLRPLVRQFCYLWQAEFSRFLQSLPDLHIKLIEHTCTLTWIAGIDGKEQA